MFSFREELTSCCFSWNAHLSFLHTSSYSSSSSLIFLYDIKVCLYIQNFSEFQRAQYHCFGNPFSNLHTIYLCLKAEKQDQKLEVVLRFISNIHLFYTHFQHNLNIFITPFCFPSFCRNLIERHFISLMKQTKA